MKKLFFLLLMVASVGAFGQVSDATLSAQSDVIKNETVAGANTKTRIASMYQSIIDSKVSILSPRLTTSSTNGYVWTANGTTGLGSWQASSGGGGWGLSGTSTLTGPVTIAGSTTNTLQYSFPSIGVTPVNGAGLWLRNPTAASNILNQISPSLVFEGQSWKSSAPIGSKIIKYRQHLVTTTNLDADPGSLFFSSSVDGASYIDLFKLAPTSVTSLKDFYITGGLQVNDNTGTQDIVLAYDDLAISSSKILQQASAGIVLQAFPNFGFTGTPDQITVSGLFGIEIKSGSTTISPNADTDGGSVLIESGPGGRALVNVYNEISTGKAAIVLQSDGLSGAGGVQLYFDPDNAGGLGAGFFINDTRVTKKGLEYAADYSGGYSTRSFVDKGYVQARALTNTATLDFPSTTSTTVANLTITVTGAAVGDAVYIGVPNGSVTTTGTFWGWVSAGNTVTVRFSPKATEDPASGTFRATVYKP